MSTDATISREAIGELATFVGLQLTKEDLDLMEAEMQSIARNMGRLDALNLDGVEPALIHFLPPSRPL